MTTEQNPDAGSPLPPNTGYEAENGSDLAVRESPKRARKTKWDELTANFSSVFGHGVGKLALSAAVLFIIVTAALAVRGLSSDPVMEGNGSKVDVPGAPTTEVSVDEISPQEADRRAQQSLMEANKAAETGQSYQPAFDPKIANPYPQGPAQPGQTPEQQASTTPPVPPYAGAQPVEVAVPQEQPANPADEQRRQTEIEKRTAAREAYVKEIQAGVMESVKAMLGDKSQGGTIRNTGTYSTVSYAPEARTSSAATTGASSPAQSAATASASAATSSNAKVVIKAGKMSFAETDAEVNTDDGSDVFATMRGGPFDGAKLIGKVEQTPRNIKFRFSTLAPQDNRPTMSINAIAIREEDARQGMADSIDHHTVARFSALFSASILSGLGKAAAQPQGTVIVLPNGQTVTQQDELSGRRIAMHGLGEVGTNAAGEMRKFIEQPPTYKTDAKRGIGIIFLNDVTTN